MRLIICLFLMSSLSVGYAENGYAETQPTGIRQKALKEIDQISVSDQDSSSSSLASPAVVKVDTPLYTDNNWRPSFELGLSAQKFLPEGSGQIVGGKSFSYSSFEAAQMFSVDLTAYLAKVLFFGEWRAGLSVFGGLAENKGKVQATAETSIDDVKIISVLYSAGLGFEYRPAIWPQFHLGYKPKWGQLSYTQASSNSYIRGNQTLGFVSHELVASYEVLSWLGLSLQYNWKSASEKSQTAQLPANQLAFGLRTWW